MTTKLIIPDSHVRFGQGLRRFKALGKLIVKRQPTDIINLGDMCDMQMLYGISAKKKWKQSDVLDVKIESELKTVSSANMALFHPIDNLNNRLRKAKKAQYNPRKVFCLGNHDIRPQLYWDCNTDVLDGVEDIYYRLSEWYDEVYPYQQPVIIDGILFAHNYISGTSMASTVDGILKIAAQSAIGGHSHKAEFSASYTATHRPIFGLQAGWFWDPDDPVPSWAGPQGSTNWWNGVIYLHGVDGSGSYDPEFISTTRLLSEYL